MSFSKVVKQARERKQWSIYRLSKASGVPWSTLKDYENGMTPTIEKADKILSALGVTMVLGEEAHNGQD